MNQILVSYLSRIGPNDYLVPVCLCIISRQPFTGLFHEILKILDNKKPLELKFPFEIYVKQFTSSIPRLPRAIYGTSFLIFEDIYMELNPSSFSQLPLCYTDFTILAKTLKAEEIVKIFDIIIGERPIIFVSKRLGLASYIIKAFLVLLYPFEYKFACFPTLPNKFLDIIQTKLIYMVGMNILQFKEIKNSIKSNVCIIKLDKIKIKSKNVRTIEANVRYRKNFNEMELIPEKDKEKLIKNISDPLKELRNLKDPKK